MLTLWDILKPERARRGRAKPRAVSPTPRRRPIQDRYDEVTKRLLAEHGVRVRKWRSSMSGVAWEVRYADGRVARLIEAPRPRGPMSAAVFMHEIGHHAIGFRTYRPRCLEEYHAWAWSLESMRRHGLNVTPAVERRMHESLHYAIAKAHRRGLKRLPAELTPFLEPPPMRPRRTR